MAAEDGAPVSQSPRARIIRKAHRLPMPDPDSVRRLDGHPDPPGPTMLSIQPFLTAYDPSDLPGSSVDPLGFDRGYALLADKILPGLTNVASRPRYLSAFCGAIFVSDQRSGADAVPRAARARRTEAVLKLERFWALGCVRASDDEKSLSTEGVRGIRDIGRAMPRINEARETNADFRLLSRQATYGMLGIYGSVAENLKLVDREALGFPSELGEQLGHAFVRETAMPNALQKAVVEDDGVVNLTTLEKWAAAAHIAGKPLAEEARALFTAYQASDIRARMGALLSEYPPLDEEAELDRLKRISAALAGLDRDPDLREALRAVVAFEDCFRAAVLPFQRVLWFCQTNAPSYDLARADRDEVLTTARAELRGASERLEVALDEAKEPSFREHLDRLRDVRAFTRDAAKATTSSAFVETVLARHRTVQRTKLDRGRSKMPWLELTDGVVTPTLALAQHPGREPSAVRELPAHPYRTAAADRFCAMGVPS